MDTAFAIRFFGALFAIMNPLVTLPIFLSLTRDLGLAEQRRTALLVTLYATVMCAAIAVPDLPAAIGSHLSKTLRVIMQRLMGMILLAIAVGMLVAGVKGLMPGLVG